MCITLILLIYLLCKEWKGYGVNAVNFSKCSVLTCKAPLLPELTSYSFFSDFTGNKLALSHVTLQKTKACLPVVVPSAYPVLPELAQERRNMQLEA